MQFIRSLLFALVFYPMTLVFVLSGMIASLLGADAARSVVHAWAKAHYWLVRHLLGIRTVVEGKMPPEPMFIAVKHQSMFETIEIVRLANTPVVVMKKELVDMPLFGWMTRRYGVIRADRDAGATALRTMLSRGKEAAASGRPIVIFPEGTRVRPGETPELRPGFAGLYRAIGLPILPIAMDSGRLWGRGLLKRSGTITFRIGEPIPAGLKREEVERRVHAAINALELNP